MRLHSGGWVYNEVDRGRKTERRESMKARINPSVCTGCGLCPAICPEVFAQNNGVATVIAGIIPKEAEAACTEAAEACPADAILI